MDFCSRAPMLGELELCFCPPLRTQDCMVPEQVPAAVQHSRLCVRPPDISEWFPVIKYTYEFMQRVIILSLLLGAGTFYSPCFFLLRQSKGPPLKISLVNSSTGKKKFGLGLSCCAIVSALIPPSNRLHIYMYIYTYIMCQHMHTGTEKSLCCFDHLRELGSLASSLTKMHWWNVSILIFLPHPPKTKVKRCFSQHV